jgi:hypothetical protein
VSRAALLAAVGLVAACGGESRARRDGDEPLTARRLYPIAVGNAWSYDVESASPDAPTLLVNRVAALEGGRVTMETGQQPIVYELRGDGIYWPAKNGYLLRDPISEGASWELGSGSHVEIVSTSKTCRAAGETFRRCVEVLLTSDEQRVRTLYVPRVGPVAIEAELRLSDLAYAFRATLRGYVVEP